MSKRKLPPWMLDNKLKESSPCKRKVTKTNEENVNSLNLNDKTQTICPDNIDSVQPPRIRTPNEINNAVNTTVKELNASNSRVLNELPSINTDQLTAIIKPQIRITTTNDMPSTESTNIPADESTRSEETVNDSDNEAAATTTTTATIIKTEPTDVNTTNISNSGVNTLVDIKPNIDNINIEEPVAIKNEAIVPPYSVLRNSCSFGIKCYRRNAEHRADLAHPGDLDYRRPIFPPAAPGVPACPWGASCYRRNPQHFQQLSHPPFDMYDPNNVGSSLTNIPTAAPQLLPRTRTRNPNRITMTSVNNDFSDDNDVDNEDDPFATDNSSDEYTPGLDIDDSDDDDDIDDTQDIEDTEDIDDNEDLEDD